jgi:transposase
MESYYSESALEQAMKIQEVILKVMSGEIHWIEAAEIIGISDRQIRRWKNCYQEHGYNGLYDRRKKETQPKRVPFETAREVLRLYREKYFDFNASHFHEKLYNEHDINLSYNWIRIASQ